MVEISTAEGGADYRGTLNVEGGKTGLNSGVEVGHTGVNRPGFPQSIGPSESSFYNFKIL